MFKIDEYEEKIDYFYDIMIANKDIVEIKISKDKWTLKEIIGHLVDSASNNHQLIIRLQIEREINFLESDVGEWKNVTKIDKFDSLELINLWKGYNYYILYLIKNIEESGLNTILRINGKESILKFIITDYFERHIDWHIELYKKRIEEIIEKILYINYED